MTDNKDKSPAPKSLPEPTRKKTSPLWIIGGIIAIILLAVGINALLKATAPKPEEEPVAKAIPGVRVMTIQKSTRQLQVETQGIVEPRTQTTLVAEVSGRIMEVSPAMEAGAFFEKGDLLLKIDDRDYQTALTNAISEVARAEADYETEKAEAEQARLDWERLGNGGEASSLLLRLPQLARAEAALTSAKAAVEKAKNDLDRTRITAPYNGRSREKLAEVGQFANVGAQLGRVFATDYVEIRLPLSDDQLGKLDPDILKYRNGEWENGPAVTVVGDVAGKERTWQGSLTRLEGVVDDKTRFYYAVARVDDPYGTLLDRDVPLTVGMFVDAIIQGKQIEEVAVIPRSALHPGDEVYFVNNEDRLEIRKVEIISADQTEAIIGSGLTDGDRIATSPLAAPVAGMQLSVIKSEAPKKAGIVADQNQNTDQREPGL